MNNRIPANDTDVLIVEEPNEAVTPALSLAEEVLLCEHAIIETLMASEFTANVAASAMIKLLAEYFASDVAYSEEKIEELLCIIKDEINKYKEVIQSIQK